MLKLKLSLLSYKLVWNPLFSMVMYKSRYEELLSTEFSFFTSNSLGGISSRCDLKSSLLSHQKKVSKKGGTGDTHRYANNLLMDCITQCDIMLPIMLAVTHL